MPGMYQWCCCDGVLHISYTASSGNTTVISRMLNGVMTWVNTGISAYYVRPVSNNVWYLATWVGGSNGWLIYTLTFTSLEDNSFTTTYIRPAELTYSPHTVQLRNIVVDGNDLHLFYSKYDVYSSSMTYSHTRHFTLYSNGTTSDELVCDLPLPYLDLSYKFIKVGDEWYGYAQRVEYNGILRNLWFYKTVDGVWSNQDTGYIPYNQSEGINSVVADKNGYIYTAYHLPVAEDVQKVAILYFNGTSISREVLPALVTNTDVSSNLVYARVGISSITLYDFDSKIVVSDNKDISDNIYIQTEQSPVIGGGYDSEILTMAAFKEFLARTSDIRLVQLTTATKTFSYLERTPNSGFISFDCPSYIDTWNGDIWVGYV